MYAIEVLGVHTIVADKELRATRILASVRHREHATVVVLTLGIGLTRDSPTRTSCAIAKILTADGIPTPSGKQKWSVSTVDSILRNEKYRGDARLQKTFTVDFLQKKMKTNEGEVPQYYVQNSHPAIVTEEQWELVQVTHLY